MKNKPQKKNKLLRLMTKLFLFASLIIIYSYFFGTKGLIIKEYSIINGKIPSNYNGIKIVHFTDIHYGTTVKTKQLKNLVNTINQLKPDIVVFTGDLIEKNYPITENEIKDVTNELNSIEAKLGKYIIKGNHDNHGNYETIINNVDFINLNNTNTLIYSNDNTPIRIIGLDDKLLNNLNIDEAFNYEPDNLYTILIMHEPDIYDEIKDYNVDLILTGHSHNGQIRLPFIGSIYNMKGAKKYYDDYYLINNTSMYISGGIGTSIIPFRLFNHPSFNFYRLYSK